MWIRIPVSICATAKAEGRQYTKRMLPDFLIPYARMRLDKVVEAGRGKESGSTMEECCRLIGCIDLRTARMHLKRLEEAAKAIALTLAERQAAAVHLHENTYPPRPFAPLERLTFLLKREEETLLRFGYDNRHLRGLRPLLQAELWKNQGKVLMSYVSRPPPES